MRKDPSHTIRQIFFDRLHDLATVQRPSTARMYKSKVNAFVSYLQEKHPEIRKLSQLRRDPHMLGWLCHLHEHQPPLASTTRLIAIVVIRRLLHDLAASNGRIREGLLIREDLPRLDKHLPKPFSPEDDLKLDRQLRNINDMYSNGILLLRATGMRVG
jgi:hypothetical protein